MSIDSDHYFWRKRIGRLQFGFTVYVHHYSGSSDRWVIRPEVIYDRKERK